MIDPLLIHPGTDTRLDRFVIWCLTLFNVANLTERVKSRRFMRALRDRPQSTTMTDVLRPEPVHVAVLPKLRTLAPGRCERCGTVTPAPVCVCCMFDEIHNDAAVCV
jgi:hypothetical protein